MTNIHKIISRIITAGWLSLSLCSCNQMNIHKMNGASSSTSRDSASPIDLPNPEANVAPAADISDLIETERLSVKPPSLENIENVCELYSNQDVARYIGGVKSPEEIYKDLEKMVQHQEKHGFSFGHVYEKETGLFVGEAGLVHFGMNDNEPEIEVGYALHQEFWGKGYATELTKAFIEWGFKHKHLCIHKIIGVCRPENKASSHVLEKAGMHYVGNINYHDRELAKYEILKNKID